MLPREANASVDLDADTRAEKRYAGSATVAATAVDSSASALSPSARSASQAAAVANSDWASMFAQRRLTA